VYHEEEVVEGVNSYKRSILGKIISDKHVHISSIQTGISAIWGSPSGLRIQETEGNVLNFYMDNLDDQEKIIQRSPWIFRNSWLILQPWDKITNPQSYNFDYVPIWIQLWGLPHHCQTKIMGKSIGNRLWKVTKYELYKYSGKKIIVKIQVEINVKNPIISGIHIGNTIDGTN